MNLIVPKNLLTDYCRLVIICFVSHKLKNTFKSKVNQNFTYEVGLW